MATTNAKPDCNAGLKSGEAECKQTPLAPGYPHRLVLFGAPGVGKGTQAELLAERLGARHVSTGDIFRHAENLNESEQTPAMKKALEYMRRGDLVPDEIMLGLLTERGNRLRAVGGFLLDGFPRTIAQAEALEKCLADNEIMLDAVIDYELPLDKIISRLSGRRSCPQCGAVYHVETRPPKVQGICDICGSALYQREDDRPESVRVRMEVYQKSTAPVSEFYRRKGLLVTVSAEGTPEEIFDRTMQVLARWQSAPSKVGT